MDSSSMAAMAIDPCDLRLAGRLFFIWRPPRSSIDSAMVASVAAAAASAGEHPASVSYSAHPIRCSCSREAGVSCACSEAVAVPGLVSSSRATRSASASPRADRTARSSRSLRDGSTGLAGCAESDMLIGVGAVVDNATMQKIKELVLRKLRPYTNKCRAGTEQSGGNQQAATSLELRGTDCGGGIYRMGGTSRTLPGPGLARSIRGTEKILRYEKMNEKSACAGYSRRPGWPGGMH